MIDKINKPTEYNAYQFSAEFTRKINGSHWKNKIEDPYKMKVGKQYKFCCIINSGIRYEINITKRTLQELEQAILNFLEL